MPKLPDGKALAEALMKEADRRQSLGHHAVAHELRGLARDVETAGRRLAYSKESR